MNQELQLVVIGALIGVVPSLVVTLINVVAQARMERKRLEAQRLSQASQHYLDLVGKDVDIILESVDAFTRSIRDISSYIATDDDPQLDLWLKDNLEKLAEPTSRATWRAQSLTSEIGILYNALREMHGEYITKAIEMREMSSERRLEFDKTAGQLLCLLRQYQLRILGAEQEE
ncbi:MAG: hypothetical protein JXJ17_06170 [Anaerolineae bacterium]|nr:hypothetical protein [Anaerolineae bacterium]